MNGTETNMCQAHLVVPRAKRESKAERHESKEEEREKINRCLIVSLTNATSSRGPLAADNKMHDLPFRLLERLATKAQQRQLREECARKRERETRITRKEERYIYIYPLSFTTTLRKATRVTFERQDDAMNYKMTVKAKVSSGFADTKEKDGRERERERDMKHGVRKV